ncbi:ribonuclease J [Loktanella atrilutea]|uniref:Ribonuclease J n=1 Tax=Loktanella atrilutea TaxID=366533 RepID=A0A1M5FLC7_LOKAT|nr:MBL fold metallo-hydrolase [Loktanella atrilutea]SHF92397.1 ribonuclease J [Loktanella atrilutea]
MELILHRGADEIGGTCIEVIHTSGARLVLDAGRPLDAPSDATGLLPLTLDLTRPATVLICHAHQDHWGLIHDLPGGWPLWAGAASARLIEITCRFARQPLARPFLTWTQGQAFAVGPFRVTPILTDHSAFDASMLLIEADDQRILYSGDFRRHGRKGALVEQIMASPPRAIDVLIMEGTNLGIDKPVMTEASLENDVADLMAATPGRLFTAWSAQNVDRTVTLYRAAKRSGRTLVIDLYTAEVLEAIAEGTRLPRPGWDKLKVVVTRGLRNHYIAADRGDFVARMANGGLSAKALNGSRHVIMLRDGLVRDYRNKGVLLGPDDAFVWSMWRGYLAEDGLAHVWAKESGVTVHHMHTSGHASAADLEAFAAAIAPRHIVPVHGQNWHTAHPSFKGLQPLANGQTMIL